ncbi:MAG: molybdopterin-dependent oxidoreductase [bacterium]|nr:molybdopterin-dependent oxidoreductase [bacterium]
MKHLFTISTLFLLVLTLFLVLSGCGTNGESEKLNALKDVQIIEYQGKDLSSIGAFRENSIKGPQQVDIENYVLKVTGLASNPAEYTYDDILDDYEHYEKVVTLDCVEGWSATGVLKSKRTHS